MQDQKYFAGQKSFGFSPREKTTRKCDINHSLSVSLAVSQRSNCPHWDRFGPTIHALFGHDFYVAGMNDFNGDGNMSMDEKKSASHDRKSLVKGEEMGKLRMNQTRNADF